jgi:cytochrome c-type biogenesis protein CcmH/NrfG
MNAAPTSPGDHGDLPWAADTSPPQRGRLVFLGLVLVAAVVVAGSPMLDAPWILGDEFIFIVDNPDVNPAADPAGGPRSLGTRLAAILTGIHEDLYQPLPILTYAVEWELTGGNVTSFRRTDLLLHALNALLLWRVLTLLLSPVSAAPSPVTPLVAWSLAFLWALHPALVTTWASDMGRTHLLSATFALLALALHHLAIVRNKWLCFVGAVVALLAAMLSKAIPGWILVVFVLETLHGGWRRALASPRLYIAGALCVACAALTLWTSARSGLAEDASKGLFGDPVARSALAVWIYFRDLVAPLWLTFWHLPDPRTGWTYPLVWLGLALALASGWHAVHSWKLPETRLITLGWTWCWALLLPVLGLVGAREVAAVDRYLYQPLMGIMLVIGVTLLRWLAAAPATSTARARHRIVPIAGALGLVMLLWDLPQCSATRGSISRAKRVAQLYPGDPRGLEALAAAYDFAQWHPLASGDLKVLPKNADQLVFFRRLWQETLFNVATCEHLSSYFPGPDDRGPFHRRLSYRFLRAGLPEQSLAQAQEAHKLLPEEYTTWVRLAQAYRALGRLDETAVAYDRAELLLPVDAKTRATHFADYGYMLMFDLGRDADACAKFSAADAATELPPLPARIGLAVCYIRYGDRAAGFQLIGEVLNDPRLRANPAQAVQAGLVLAEYHLRSHHWREAGMVYAALLRDDPTNYAALRGLTEVCVQADTAADSVPAWRTALRLQPGRREFRSFVVWVAALAAAETARTEAEALLVGDEDNPLACLALAICAVRAGDPAEAVEWVRRATFAQPIPKAREFDRAAAALKLLAGRDQLPAEAAIVQAAVLAHMPPTPTGRAQAEALLDEFVHAHPDSPWLDLVRRVRSELSDPEPRS